jgi:hypothetical protein
MSKKNRRSGRTSTIGTSAEPGHANLKEDAQERGLDEALDDTFPASDPIAVTPGPGPDRKIDRALKDTFPASDPIAIGSGRKNSRED